MHFPQSKQRIESFGPIIWKMEETYLMDPISSGSYFQVLPTHSNTPTNESQETPDRANIFPSDRPGHSFTWALTSLRSNLNGAENAALNQLTRLSTNLQIDVQDAGKNGKSWTATFKISDGSDTGNFAIILKKDDFNVNIITGEDGLIDFDYTTVEFPSGAEWVHIETGYSE